MAKETGLKVSAISNYENGIRTPRPETMEILTDYFNVDTDYVLGRTDVKNSIGYDGVYNAGYRDGLKESAQRNFRIRTVPIYDPISCGNGSWIFEHPEDYVGVPDYMTCRSAVYFANSAQGDSMEPRIHNGDCIVFETMSEIESGQIGAFSLNGSYYCKVFKRLPDGSCWLFSENPAYDPIPISPEDEFRTLGLYRIHVSIEQ